MNSYDPSEPVTRFTETPVSGLSRVIVASTTTAPDESRTVPTTAAVSNCAQAGPAASIAARATIAVASNRRMRLLLRNIPPGDGVPRPNHRDRGGSGESAPTPGRSGTIPPTPGSVNCDRRSGPGTGDRGLGVQGSGFRVRCGE